MWRRGRPLDNPVGQEESLHVRFRQEHAPDGNLAPNAIRFPDQSVNRSRYARPFDALLPEPGNEKSRQWLLHGVFAFQARRACDEASYPTAKCSIRIEHDPLDWNYSHSEIRVYMASGERVAADTKKAPLTRAQRQAWRMHCFEGAAILIHPFC
jgi:hypothetical protein